MHADLERLIALQQLDSSAHESRRRLAEEPDQRRGFDERLDEVSRRVDAAREKLAANVESRRQSEKDLALQQGRLSKFRDQLMAVKTNVEYLAMQKEIGFAQSEVKALEDGLLERMLEADELTGEVKRAEGALAAEQKSVDADRRTLEQELARLRSALALIDRERESLVSTLLPHLLTTYESVASRRNGVVVAEAKEGVCTVCHVRLRPQVFNHVRQNSELVQCDSCQRFLYFKPAPLGAADAPDAAARPSL